MTKEDPFRVKVAGKIFLDRLSNLPIDEQLDVIESFQNSLAKRAEKLQKDREEAFRAAIDGLCKCYGLSLHAAGVANFIVVPYSPDFWLAEHKEED